MDHKDFILRQDSSFLIKDYNAQHPFSDFLPGVAGKWGTPAWVFYINRGQAISSFGTKDKDHAIMEYFPANKAYRNTSSMGFRTFIKGAGGAYEPFRAAASDRNQEMLIKSAALSIAETNSELGLKVTVKYFTLPGLPIAALARVVTFENIGSSRLGLSVADGMACIIPFGCVEFFVKHMSRTIEAWMRVELTQEAALYRLVVDPHDTSVTRYVEGANFNYSFLEKNGRATWPVRIADPAALFGLDLSYERPGLFFDGAVEASAQVLCCKTPCAFSLFDLDPEPGQAQTLYSLFGVLDSGDPKTAFAGFDPAFFKAKEQENERLIEGDIKDNALCVSAKPEFDQYVRSCYLDNVLRGGLPYSFDNGESYYLFSRKHGDLERDYNRFRVLPGYFSEGETNYRDVDQNRRLDIFFNPAIKDKNIVYFLNLTRIDGYNPLVTKGERLKLDPASAARIFSKAAIKKDKDIAKLLAEGFRLGELFTMLAQKNLLSGDRDALVAKVLAAAKRSPQAAFGEGFWIDHWQYNLDLIENYLYFFPEKTRELFFKKQYMFWDDEHSVKPRLRRYSLHHGKVYQWHSLERSAQKEKAVQERTEPKDFLRDAKGKVYQTTLVEKLLVLILNKAATLDPEGIGVEMEADKPGWCDSLNGLPAMFGSSLCETYALKRACLILGNACRALREQGVKTVALNKDTLDFLKRLEVLLGRPAKGAKGDYIYWDRANLAKENFRAKTFWRISSRTAALPLVRLENFLVRLTVKLQSGINKAKDPVTGVPHAYFRYAVLKYKKTKDGLMPVRFKRHALPLFLEGPVHALRDQRKKEDHQAVKRSPLYDKVLKMYLLNASLESEPLEIGRSRIFPLGWLENETVWLHMEYKYLLELLKSRLYQEFFQELPACCVCFFDPARYGRSILENSSFIVSSHHQDKNLWGKGFVARLSGATVEMLDIWMTMSLGHMPFSVDRQGNITLEFKPILPASFFTGGETVTEFRGRKERIPADAYAFTMFSRTLVVYTNPLGKDTWRDCPARKITVEINGNKHIIKGSSVTDQELVEAIRQGEASRIDVQF